MESLVPVAITEQTTRGQSLSDRTRSASPLWRRSFEEHKHSKHRGGHHQRRDIAEGRSPHPINAAKDRGMERKHKYTKTNVRVVDGPVQHFPFAPALSTTSSCPSYLRRSVLDKSSHVPTIHAVLLLPSRLDHQYGATSSKVASVQDRW